MVISVVGSSGVVASTGVVGTLVWLVAVVKSELMMMYMYFGKFKWRRNV